MTGEKMNKQEELALMLGQTIFNNAIKEQQAKIDDLLVNNENLVLSNIQLATINAEQAEQLKALRGFAKVMVDQYPEFYELYDKFGFCDENGNPTKLLTGEK